MSARRRTIVIGVPFLLLTGYLTIGSLHAQSTAQNAAAPSNSTPLPGANSMSGLRIDQTKAGMWTAEFDYLYTGEPPSAALAVELTAQPDSPPGPNGVEQYQTVLPRPQQGAHHAASKSAIPAVR
jgi:hypothetical protein